MPPKTPTSEVLLASLIEEAIIQHNGPWRSDGSVLVTTHIGIVGHDTPCALDGCRVDGRIKESHRFGNLLIVREEDEV